MKISMIPNKDVKTIHASQYDNSPRKWAFEPYDHNGAINVSNIKDQLVYKTENGGTEQLLPVNTSTPTTSYFDGTINYGTDADVEFTYKQSSCTGQARIKSIKGNTLVWNQLVGELDATTTWNDIAITNNGNGSLTLNGTYSGSSIGNMYITTGSVSIKANHVYFLDTSCSTLADQTVRIGNSSSFGVLKGGYEFHKPVVDLSGRLDFRVAVGRTYNDTIFPNMFDLTDMFGETVANEILAMETAHTGDGVAYFRSLFPLSYYAYGQYLLNFNGTGIKTTGKNQAYFPNPDYEFPRYGLNVDVNGSEMHVWGKPTSGNQGIYSATHSNSYDNAQLGYYLPGTYKIQVSGFKHVSNGTRMTFIAFGVNGSTIKSITNIGNGDVNTFTADQIFKIALWAQVANGDEVDLTAHIMLTTEDDVTYEPYTTSTLSLPISTYFPTGMKNAGSVYDELSDKAITRVGQKTYNGGITSMESQNKLFILGAVNDIVIYEAGVVGNLVANGYTANSLNSARLTDDNYIVSYNKSFYLRIKGVTTVADANTYLSTNPVTINYELATYTETDIQNASLVCKNIEVPCYLDNGNLVCDATEELTSESGFFDAKLKLKDSSSVAYSSKFKLHVEGL